MSMAYMYMLDVHLFDEVALCRPNTGPFLLKQSLKSTRTIIKWHKNYKHTQTHSVSLKWFDGFFNSYFTDMYDFIGWTRCKTCVVLPVYI